MPPDLPWVFEVNTFLLALPPAAPLSRLDAKPLTQRPNNLQIPPPIQSKVQHLFMHMRLDPRNSIDQDIATMRVLEGLKSVLMNICCDGV